MANTPPVTPREPIRGPIVVFDLDGTLTSVGGGTAAQIDAQSLFAAWMKAPPNESELSVARRYTEQYVSEPAYRAVSRLLRDLADAGVTLVLATNNFENVARAYLSLFDGADDLIDWELSVCRPQRPKALALLDRLHTVLNPAAHPLEVYYLDDDADDLVQLELAWAKTDLRPLCRTYHLARGWLGVDVTAQQFLRYLSPNANVEAASPTDA